MNFKLDVVLAQSIFTVDRKGAIFSVKIQT